MPVNHNDYVYRFCLCGYVPLRNDTSALWVRYKSGHEQAKAEPIITCVATETGAYVDTPNRELYFDRAFATSNSARPLRNWDECIHTGFLYHTGNDYSCDRLMINHTAFSAREEEMALRTGWLDEIQTDKIVICDSGGFQLRSGKEFWIDPEKLTEFYNDNVDEGVTLDVPIPTYDRDLLKRMLKIQAKNSKLILSGLDKNVRLMNVAHGVDYSDFMFVRERLHEDERMDILCIPSSVIIPDIKSIDRLAYHLTHGQTYKQYHLLGVYNTTWLSLAIKLVTEWNKQVKQPILLTSDASSSIYSASTLRWHKQVVPYRSVSRWPIGFQAPAIGRALLPSKTLSCPCPVCSAIHYSDVFNLLSDINIAAPLTRHNEFETVQWTRLMCEAAATLDTKDYIQLCLEQLGGARDKRATLEAFAYMEMFLQEGWDKTHAKYRHRVSALFAPKTKETVLFDTSHDGLAPNEDIGALNQHLSDVLTRYEKYHSTGKKPKLPKSKNGKSFFGMMGSNSAQLQAK